MGLILDTSILIAAERQKLDLDLLLLSQAETAIHLSSVSASELLHGVHRATNPRNREKRSRFVEDVLVLFPIIPFDLAASRRHARLWALLEQMGQMIGSHDLLIAATALEHGHSIATLNESEFSRVPDLQLLDVSSFRLS